MERGDIGCQSIEVIVIDDGSSDDTADQAAKMIGRLQDPLDTGQGPLFRPLPRGPGDEGADGTNDSELSSASKRGMSRSTNSGDAAPCKLSRYPSTFAFPNSVLGWVRGQAEAGLFLGLGVERTQAIGRTCPRAVPAVTRTGPLGCATIPSPHRPRAGVQRPEGFGRPSAYCHELRRAGLDWTEAIRRVARHETNQNDRLASVASPATDVWVTQFAGLEASSVHAVVKTYTSLKGTLMSDGAEPADKAGEQLGGTPSPDSVASRAGGRPPEEVSSDDPSEQAEAILQESEDRVTEGAEGSEPIPE